MTTRRRSTQERTFISSEILPEHKSIPSSYEKQLENTFRLYATETKGGKLSIRKLQLAMRTLGFEATIDDVREIVDKTPSLSIHQRKNRQMSSQHKSHSNSRNKTEKTKNKNTNTGPQATTSTITGARRGSRAVIVASRSGSTPKYFHPDDDDGIELDSDEDMYRDEPEHNDSWDEDEDRDSDDDPQFTLSDFITLMTPDKDQFIQDEVSRVFQLFDTQGKGTVRLEDLRRVVTNLGISMNDDELREMIEEADPSGKGGVSENAFKDIMKNTGFLDEPDMHKL
ncbi:hypothetical protein BGZ65_011340 [Modicella reniformis]|uniref:EF-hand domain-containing protein n=1 Tax=Modicella reniformis TaxID=1440133 RepID=A0A9P6IH86_9FUNG|nr:hypothetical protein BGZ65_011340 [Modicella reniformis]